MAGSVEFDDQVGAAGDRPCGRPVCGLERECLVEARGGGVAGHDRARPLHVMQVDLLRRHRAGDHDELVERGIQLTLNTIATGLRNSG